MLKRINVLKNYVALVFKNGQLEEVLEMGKYWIYGKRKVEIYNKALRFSPQESIDLLLKYPELSNKLDVIEVKDNQIAIQYFNNLFQMVLPTGKYAFWKDMFDYKYQMVDLSNIEVSDEIDSSILNKVALAPYIKVYNVPPYEKGLLYVNGQFQKVLNPGKYCYWISDKTTSMSFVDLRQQNLEVNGQELLTKDKANIRLNFSVLYKVVDECKVVESSKDSIKSLYTLMQLGLREFTGMQNLDELLSNKEQASPYILNFVKDEAEKLGMEVLQCGIRDIILPGDIKEIMNQVLIAEKKAQANVIMRREETASTRSLLNTAKLMEENAMLYKLKEMEYVEKIAENVKNITLSGGGQLVEQLKTIFTS